LDNFKLEVKFIYNLLNYLLINKIIKKQIWTIL